MPNWAYCPVRFTGEKENLKKLVHDIEKAIEWQRGENYKYVNVFKLLELSDFHAHTYNESYNVKYGIHFRGSALDGHLNKDEQGNYVLDVCFEMAWDMDYNLLHLLSLIYNIKFSAYCEEPAMEVYTKCRNGDNTMHDYDYVVIPDYDQLDESGLDIPFAFPVQKSDSNDDGLKMVKELEENNIEYSTIDVFEDNNGPRIYGTYYELKYGVRYV